MWTFRSARSQQRLKKLLSRHSLALLISLSLILFIAWARTFPVDIFVHGTGKVTADSHYKIVEHLEGGILAELHVSEGQKVQQDMLMFVVDNPKLKEAMEILTGELTEKRARLQRLKAEKTFANFSPDGIGTENQILRNYLQNEQHLYRNRQQTLADHKAIISQKITRQKARQQEIRQTIIDLRKELAVIREQRDMLESLIDDRAGSRSNLLSKRLDVLKIETRINQSEQKLATEAAELKELELQKKQIDSDFREKVQEEFNRETARVALLEARINASRQQAVRSEIRSPVSGTLHRLITSTIGEVVSPGSAMAEIVPENDPLMIEASILPRDRARIWLGQTANIRVSAYDYSSHGGLVGTVTEISADTFQSDGQQGEFYRISIVADEHGFGSDKPLRQGMRVDVYIVSGQQSLLSYLLPDHFTGPSWTLKWPENQRISSKEQH
ncbi:HlyD family type I secretion periplasmic adaptor subunit [Endozoicomonas sp. ONNA2]|uniref:HlyD family type I secretion periplasmic adaptor subunit n=1 Tax=Endozoicomonas sp. ONNA2 TaxID=2828741 RepID=UPI0021479E5E|nr:HlyD family type I secretion periplasmic adaptor subunit [Endozoicomonas sp. ONNA2]